MEAAAKETFTYYCLGRCINPQKPQAKPQPCPPINMSEAEIFFYNLEEIVLFRTLKDAKNERDRRLTELRDYIIYQITSSQKFLIDNKAVPLKANPKALFNFKFVTAYCYDTAGVDIFAQSRKQYTYYCLGLCLNPQKPQEKPQANSKPYNFFPSSSSSCPPITISEAKIFFYNLKRIVLFRTLKDAKNERDRRLTELRDYIIYQITSIQEFTINEEVTLKENPKALFRFQFVNAHCYDTAGVDIFAQSLEKYQSKGKALMRAPNH